MPTKKTLKSKAESSKLEKKASSKIIKTSPKKYSKTRTKNITTAQNISCPTGLCSIKQCDKGFLIIIFSITIILLALAFLFPKGGESPKISENNSIKMGNSLIESLSTGDTIIPEVRNNIEIKEEKPKLENENLLPISSKDYINGEMSAKFTLITYSDFECPFCQRFYPGMIRLLNTNKGKVNLVYRHFPLPFHGEIAMKESEALECAGEIGGSSAYWGFIEKMYSLTKLNGKTEETVIYDIISQLNIDKEKFNNCYKSGKNKSIVEEGMRSGVKAGIKGTPGSFIIDNTTGKVYNVYGSKPYEYLQKVIDGTLE